MKSTGRFTLDGSAELERRLTEVCAAVADGVRAIVSGNKLEALVLAGGYGRGEGGVLKTEGGDLPYNDLEFYVFVKGSRLLAERRFGPGLHELGARLSPAAELHVEFKIDSLEKLRRSPITMFSYDLVSQHRVLYGENVFCGCNNHLQAETIPAAEATRLLFNRCTGLLLAQEMLNQAEFGAEQADFVGRNLAKCRLALGDAVLTLSGLYHWSVVQRKTNLQQSSVGDRPAWFETVRKQHALGAEFKLHPKRANKPAAAWKSEHAEIVSLALEIWLWVESQRLKRRFVSAQDYATDGGRKWGAGSSVRNYLLNLRTFGLKAGLDSLAWRYPRERLLNALPLLLWNDKLSNQPEVTRHLQQQLRSEASGWADLVAAYKQAWPQYG
jgi:hypothetical protein